MKQLISSMIMGFLCLSAWVFAAPILNQKSRNRIEKKINKIVKEEKASEAQTLTM